MKVPLEPLACARVLTKNGWVATATAHNGLFDRIIAAPGQGMATCYPPERQQGSPDRAVLGNRFNRILGTGGNETAGRGKKGRKKILISPEQGNQAFSRYLAPAGTAMRSSDRGAGRLYT